MRIQNILRMCIPDLASAAVIVVVDTPRLFYDFKSASTRPQATCDIGSAHILVPPPHPVNRWNESAQSRELYSVSQGGSILDHVVGEHDYNEHDEGLDEISELGHGGADDASGWSEASPNRSDGSPMPSRIPGDGGGEHDLASVSTLPLNVGNVSVASWDAGSEPTLGTDGGTDQDIVAASGLPEGESNDDEEDDDFEVADSLDLGAVALCVSVGILRCAASYRRNHSRHCLHVPRCSSARSWQRQYIKKKKKNMLNSDSLDNRRR